MKVDAKWSANTSVLSAVACVFPFEVVSGGIIVFF